MAERRERVDVLRRRLDRVTKRRDAVVAELGRLDAELNGLRQRIVAAELRGRGRLNGGPARRLRVAVAERVIAATGSCRSAAEEDVLVRLVEDDGE